MGRLHHHSSSLEFHCCREVIDITGKFVFDNSIESMNCITEHEDYSHQTNRSVLSMVAPLRHTKVSRVLLTGKGIRHESVEVSLFLLAKITTKNYFLSKFLM